MVKVQANPNGSFTLTISERALKVLKRASSEWSLDEATHLENLLINLFENKIQEYHRQDGPIMVRQYEALSEQDQRMIDKLLTPEPEDA